MVLGREDSVVQLFDVTGEGLRTFFPNDKMDTLPIGQES